MTPTVEFAPIPRLEDLELEWRQLEGQSDNSFFQSWTWIGTWLATVAIPHFDPERLRVVRVRDCGRLIGLGVASLAPQEGRAGWLGKSFVLHETGDARLDRITVEYNSFLSEHGRTADVLVAAVQAAVTRASTNDRAWTPSRAILNCIPDVALEALRSAGMTHRAWRTDSCPIISRARSENGLDAYLGSLHRNARSQIRRSAKLMGGLERIHAIVAGPDAALAYYDEMKALHQKAWTARKGMPGAFEDPVFDGFAKRLVAAGSENGQVTMVRVCVGERTIGILMNFRYRGHSYAYQSGFDFVDDNRIKPGLVCHVFAAQRALHDGDAAYHFMAGESRYKRSLGNDAERLHWVEVGQPGPAWWAGTAAFYLRRIARLMPKLSP